MRKSDTAFWLFLTQVTFVMGELFGSAVPEMEWWRFVLGALPMMAMWLAFAVYFHRRKE